MGFHPHRQLIKSRKAFSTRIAALRFRQFFSGAGPNKFSYVILNLTCLIHISITKSEVTSLSSFRF